MGEIPTPEERQKMFDTKMNVIAEINGLSHEALRVTSERYGIPMDLIAGRAIFLGLSEAIKEIQDMDKIEDDGL